LISFISSVVSGHAFGDFRFLLCVFVLPFCLEEFGILSLAWKLSQMAVFSGNRLLCGELFHPFSSTTSHRYWCTGFRLPRHFQFPQSDHIHYQNQTHLYFPYTQTIPKKTLILSKFAQRSDPFRSYSCPCFSTNFSSSS